MAGTDEILDHHLAAFGAGDIDDILTDYSDESVMIYGDRAWRGLAGAREFFAMWLDGLLPPGCSFELTARVVVDDLACICWTAESDDYRFEFGTDTFVVRDGKVVRQTVATHHRRK